jgi:hypothetical protein
MWTNPELHTVREWAQYMRDYNEMHSGIRRGIRACMLVTWARKAGFGEHGFVFQFCDNQNVGASFENLH